MGDFGERILAKLTYSLGKTRTEANKNDWYWATALAVRDFSVERWHSVRAVNQAQRKKRVYYLSIEFLIGGLLFDSLANLGLLDAAREALKGFGQDLDEMKNIEPDAALGNGGLGRLAACYMDSMAALGIPAYGYGLRYEHGLFEQRIHEGQQIEYPESWLKNGYPWELARPEKEYIVGFGGTVQYTGGDEKTACAVWIPDETVLATTQDVPITGWRGKHVNMLRLWGARAPAPIQLIAFNKGDHLGAMAARNRAEAITRVLYPDDHTPHGQELRLRQEYFFTAASLQDIIRRHREQFGDIKTLPIYAAIQLNDTHPAIAVAELMRILVDDFDLSWTEAWQITRATLSFTNHTLMPEALETWSVDLFGRLLPRHLQIIYLINWLHLQQAGERGLTDPGLISRISLIDENNPRRIRMAHLAYLGSHHVNGVSALHTDLLRKTIFNDLSKASPTVIVNKTNGISFRRWLFTANSALTQLLKEVIGEKVIDQPEFLSELEGKADDAAFVEEYKKIRKVNKRRLQTQIATELGVQIDADALFDIHVKRIHEYKRQSLNLLETIALFLELRDNPAGDFVPRVKIIAGKAAPGYERAKVLIRLAHDIASTIENEPLVRGRLKLIFVPNYGVRLAEKLIPAADLSEQISTAGMEASGTGNMKLALNGALTIGTLDGANIEIRERVGLDNFFLFGLTADEIAQFRANKIPGEAAADACPRLKRALASLDSGMFSPEEPGRYRSLSDAFLHYDPFMVAADFPKYWDTQRVVDRAWQEARNWWRSSILNTSRMSWFSSDRAVREYASEVWRVPVV